LIGFLIVFENHVRLEEDPKVRVIIVTGKGKYFCTGMDLSSANQADLSDRLQSGSAAENSMRLFESFRNCRKPIISRINGPAMGGGWGLIFTTDIRIASPKSFFWFAEIKRGIVPALISAYIVPEIGAFKAKQLFLTGQKISPQNALELGLITAVADDSDSTEDESKLDKLVEVYVKELLEGGPGAGKAIKVMVNEEVGAAHERNREIVKKVFAATVQSEEAVYGMSCFIQKQKPDWASFIQQQRQLAKL
jgi:methylglutaconyl-CoA hydratase